MMFHAIVPFQSLRNERFGGSSFSIIPQFLHPTSYNNISKHASIVDYESKGRYGI
jgi:hypothetical protein